MKAANEQYILVFLRCSPTTFGGFYTVIFHMYKKFQAPWWIIMCSGRDILRKFQTYFPHQSDFQTRIFMCSVKKFYFLGRIFIFFKEDS